MNDQKGTSTILPMMLSVKGYTVVIVGGGKIATRRILPLLEVEVNVIVISPEVTADIKTWHGQQRLHWKAKCFEPIDIKNAAIVIAATNDPKVNLQVYEASEKHQLINLADRPNLSNFYVPATFRRGKLILSVSTSGASPGLARQIKQQLSEIYDENYESYVEFLDQCRQIVKSTSLNQQTRNNILKELLKTRYRHMDEREREEAFKQLLEKEGGKQNE
ncbi:NAD(P)-binding protein [Pueribacillus theae]|uniref:precorrin-2 dehydrogenase n=1 Tax=Pueribacillus theae TaxID=2171751 RepID=A0A2U1K4L1_9BACI|nr:NAD(P)-binding protein [Pueribacillus theae]PWA12205.1 NAD(P)-binding protein [Pueribacillus theae]